MNVCAIFFIFFTLSSEFNRTIWIQCVIEAINVKTKWNGYVLLIPICIRLCGVKLTRIYLFNYWLKIGINSNFVPGSWSAIVCASCKEQHSSTVLKAVRDLQHYCIEWVNFPSFSHQSVKVLYSTIVFQYTISYKQQINHFFTLIFRHIQCKNPPTSVQPNTLILTSLLFLNFLITFSSIVTVNSMSLHSSSLAWFPHSAVIRSA